MDTQSVITGYVECALWSSIDDDGEPLDKNYSVGHIADESMVKIAAEVRDFVKANASDLNYLEVKYGVPDGGWSRAEQVGHDFWLTRNHHGAGFWDRGYDAVGDRLTEAAHGYGESNLYVGDDGAIHVQ